MQQIVRRIHEKQRAGKRRTVSASSARKQPHLSGPVTEELATCQQYRQYNDGQRFISCSKGDNCFTVEVRILILRNIVPRCEPVKVLSSLKTVILFSTTQLTWHASKCTVSQSYLMIYMLYPWRDCREKWSSCHSNLGMRYCHSCISLHVLYFPSCFRLQWWTWMVEVQPLYPARGLQDKRRTAATGHQDESTSPNQGRTVCSKPRLATVFGKAGNVPVFFE